MADCSTDASYSSCAEADAAMQLRTSWTDEVAVLSVRGVVDVLTAPLLAEAVDEVLLRKPAGIVVDMSAVEFLASAGMMVLVSVRSRLEIGQGLVVVADGPATSRPMKLIGIDSIIGMHRTLDDALLDVAPTPADD
jgi:anti-sigma B factor antagonist